MFSDIPPALQYNFMDCFRNQEKEPPTGLIINQAGECYSNFFNLAQQSHQQSLSNWQAGDLSAIQQRYVSDTLVVAGCNPLIPNTVCLQNPNNPNLFHSYNVPENKCQSKKKEKKRTKKNELCKPLCQHDLDKAVQDICNILQSNPKPIEETSKKERNRKKNRKEIEKYHKRIFPKWRTQKKYSKDEGKENDLPPKNEIKSPEGANYQELIDKIDIWTKINCRMIRHLCKKIENNRCECQKYKNILDKRLAARDSGSDDPNQSNCVYTVECQYEESSMDFIAVSEKPKKQGFLFWKKIKKGLKYNNSLKEENSTIRTHHNENLKSELEELKKKTFGTKSNEEM